MSAKQLWRWQGINNEGQPLEGVLWADTRPSLMLARATAYYTATYKPYARQSLTLEP